MASREAHHARLVATRCLPGRMCPSLTMARMLLSLRPAPGRPSFGEWRQHKRPPVLAVLGQTRAWLDKLHSRAVRQVRAGAEAVERLPPPLPPPCQAADGPRRRPIRSSQSHVHAADAGQRDTMVPPLSLMMIHGSLRLRLLVVVMRSTESMTRLTELPSRPTTLLNLMMRRMRMTMKLRSPRLHLNVAERWWRTGAGVPP